MLPNNLDAGGILYADILKNYGLEKFRFISLQYPLKEEHINLEISKQIIEQYSFRIPRKNFFYKVMRKIPLLDTCYVFFNLLLCQRKIIESINKEDFDAIFAPLRGDVLLILPLILKKTSLPLYAMGEDTVEAEILDSNVLYKMKKKAYYDLLKSVVSLGVAGETMNEYFRTKFNLNSIILRPSHEKFSSIYPKILNHEVNIFFAGNTYAERELKAFIKALEIASASTSSIITFYIASHKSYFSSSDKLIINNLGWRTQGELMGYIDKCHISYLPYRMESKFKHQMMYAFPGKSGFYVSNNLPVFFHGPAYSSFNTFLKYHAVGVACDSLSPEIISARFMDFLGNDLAYLKYQDECRAAFHTKFSKEVFSKNVSDFFKLNNVN